MATDNVDYTTVHTNSVGDMSNQSPNIHLNVEAISGTYKGILLDAWGVFWGGNDIGPLPGTIETMQRLVSNGHIVGILSNNTQLAQKEIKKLQTHGVLEGIHYHFFLTSGEIIRKASLAQQLIPDTSKKKFWVFGGSHPKYFSHKEIFKGSIYQETDELHEADFIYIGVPHIDGVDQIDPEMFYNEVLELKKTGLLMICGNPDRFAHEGKPTQLVVRQGTIAAMYEKLGGRVLYFGKPYQSAYSEALNHFSRWGITNPEEILMVGDTPETDIRGAISIGMSSALVLQTGIMSERISNCGLEVALKQLPVTDQPDYYIERF